MSKPLDYLKLFDIALSRNAIVFDRFAPKRTLTERLIYLSDNFMMKNSMYSRGITDIVFPFFVSDREQQKEFDLDFTDINFIPLTDMALYYELQSKYNSDGGMFPNGKTELILAIDLRDMDITIDDTDKVLLLAC